MRFLRGSRIFFCIHANYFVSLQRAKEFDNERNKIRYYGTRRDNKTV